MTGRWVIPFLVLTACSTVGNVKTDFDDKADFGKFKTYAFLEAKEMGKPGPLSNTLVHQRVEGLLKEQMDSLGLRQVPMAETPDLLVQYWVGVREKQDDVLIPANPTPFTRSHLTTSYDRTVSYDYREGTLMVDLIDGESKNLVWQATLVQALEESKDTNLNVARKSLKKAFQHFPTPAK